jgi:type VI secretion system ImpM family protein
MLFGKLPGHGDFIARGLDEAAHLTWETWAEKALALAHARLGERFGMAHDQAPPWCFLSGPCSFGPGWRTGVLAPSVDSAGRRFILVVGADNLTFSQAVGLCVGTMRNFIESLYRILSETLQADAAVALIEQSAGFVGEIAPLECVLQARSGGVWWPHAGGDVTPWLHRSAEPDDELMLRALSFASGDVAP